MQTAHVHIIVSSLKCGTVGIDSLVCLPTVADT